jgi:23S rRNA (adenine2503-C2)-methyltransferase
MKNLRHLSILQLEEEIDKLGEKKFRAKQIHEWLWQKGVTTIDEMSNLSLAFKDTLKKYFVLEAVEINHSQFSTDGTVKNRFVLHDGYFIEGVLIPTEHRLTACVSSQVGCSLTCKFCATGKMDRKRNLDYTEIVDQVMHINKQCEKQYNKKLTNIVYMGMGEPLLNYKNVLKSIEAIASPEGLGMSPSRITVSTAGIAKAIRNLADDKVKFNLAVSLHAADDLKRNEIMPINESNNLKVLLEALDYYFKATKNHVTFEYILFKDFNDSIEDAENLIKICRRIPSKVNIIEYNAIEDTLFENPEEDKVQQFMNYLEKHKVNARLRRSRGKDIDAACGQLANINTVTNANN